MGYLLDVLLCGLVVFGEITIIVLGGLLIQLIFYKVLKINLYKIIINSLDKLEKYIEREVN